jgi:hypothetical protein
MQKQELVNLSPVEKVLHFWNNVWSPPYNLDLIDELMPVRYYTQWKTDRTNRNSYLGDQRQQAGA